MYSASQPSNVNIASVDYLFTVNSSYITIQNLTFTGTNTAAIYNSEPGDIYTGLIVQNCSILYSGGYGIKLKMLNLTVNNNIISNTNNSGILIPQQGNTDIITITGNTVTNSGVFQGMGNTGSAFDGISVSNKQNGFIENNTVINSGYCGISVGGASNLIKNNFVNTFCTILDDGGGIYTYNTQNHIITGNIVLNGVGAYYGTPGTTTIANGIYLDFGTVYSTVSYNTCANNANYGIFTDAGNTTLIYNTCFNNLTQYLENDHNGNSVNNAIYNNIFISKSSTQLAVEYDYLSADPQDIGTQNSNYYSRPVTGDGAIIREWPESGSAVNMTLSQWQAFSSQDANSKGSPETIPSASDFQFAYNNTTSNSVVTLAQPMTDITGKAYAGSVTLSPFTSIVLLADVVAPSVPTGLAAVAASAIQVNLSWSASTDNVGVAGYEVFRNGLFLSSTTVTSYSNTGLTPLTTYTYNVLAYDASMNLSAQCTAVSTTTLADTIPPTAPGRPQVTNATASQISLSWEAATDNAGVAGYSVFRNNIFLTSTTALGINDINVIPAGLYTYTVTAYDTSGNLSVTPSSTTVKVPGGGFNVTFIGTVGGGVSATNGQNTTFQVNIPSCAICQGSNYIGINTSPVYPTATNLVANSVVEFKSYNLDGTASNTAFLPTFDNHDPICRQR